MNNDIYLTEMSLKELLEGKIIYDDNNIIHPPKTNELDLQNPIKTCKDCGEKIKTICYHCGSENIK